MSSIENVQQCKEIENILRKYPVTLAKIQLAELEIETIQGNYKNSFKPNGMSDAEYLTGLTQTKNALQIEIEKINAALSVLNERELELVTAHYFKGLNADKTAELLEITTNHFYKIKKAIIAKRLLPFMGYLHSGTRQENI